MTNRQANASAGIAAEDWAALRSAAAELEHPSLAARITSVVGTPIEEGLRLLPPAWNRRLHETTESVLLRTLDIAVSTLPASPTPTARHRRMGMVSGAVGGYFGLPGLLLELPVTTMLILRSIASIAAREGEDLSSMEARLSCMEVFALGGPSSTDDAAETGYFSLRMMLAYHFSNVSEAVVARGLGVREIPALVGLVRAIAARFGLVITDKAAFQLVPIFGAAGGALINAIFVDHFQQMARGHFTVRRLERKYGADSIRKAYESVAANMQAPPEPVRPSARQASPAAARGD
jgi:hypothetical protein